MNKLSHEQRIAAYQAAIADLQSILASGEYVAINASEFFSVHPGIDFNFFSGVVGESVVHRADRVGQRNKALPVPANAQPPAPAA